MTTFEEVTLLRNKNNESPTFIGPTMIHFTKDKDSYADLLFELKKKLPPNKSIAVIGSDDDKAIEAAIK